MRDWRKVKRDNMTFAILTVSREGKDLIMDCYFFMINLKGINCKNKHHVQYPNVPSVIRLMTQTFLFLSPMVTWNIVLILKIVTHCCSWGWHIQARRGWPASTLDTSRTQWPDSRPESAQLLGSHLKEKHLLAPGITFYWYQDHERELRPSFTFQDKSSLVYRNNIAGLIQSMGLEYDATQWRLFIDSSSRSLKAVLLHNWISFSSTPIGHSVQTKETHNSNGSFAVCCSLPGTQIVWSVEILWWFNES